MSAVKTVTVTVPVTFEISVELPATAGTQAAALAEAVAVRAAEHFAHVGQAQIRAFNEVNRVHPQGPGVITAVDSHPDSLCKAAA
ncbi:hypothetical protein [Azospirillum sp. TSO35-2]|uniref:hypothetical protein n=1 Tax=Azospirillum sp. TSO35-2 TaxID=716796 RepID=UPI000D60694C|nr:hypothetical protein [Azospirillum sp. TSO35-2]PWC36065.1 hypothetical protein TSO352_12930 [Azospirillum sp. TSO35-2]